MPAIAKADNEVNKRAIVIITGNNLFNRKIFTVIKEVYDIQETNPEASK